MNAYFIVKSFNATTADYGGAHTAQFIAVSSWWTFLSLGLAAASIIVRFLKVCPQCSVEIVTAVQMLVSGRGICFLKK